jgi:hypothetical protein
MDDDLDTPRAIAALERLADEIIRGGEMMTLEHAQIVLRDRCAILGLRLDKDGPEEIVAAGWENHRKRFTD